MLRDRRARCSTRIERFAAGFCTALLGFQVLLVPSVAAWTEQDRPLQAGQDRPAELNDRVLWADTVLQARGLSVTDDGTIVFSHESESVPVKLARVVLPSVSDELRAAAMRFLASAVEGQRLEVVLEGGIVLERSRKPHRARIYSGGRNVAEVLVRRGLARYCKGTRHDVELESAAEAALSDAVGIWATAETRSKAPECAESPRSPKTP